MVKFRLIADSHTEAVYHYYPEGDTEGYGIIILDKSNGSVRVEKMADNDSVRHITVDEQIKMRDGINKSRINEGLKPFDDDEFTVISAYDVFFYATPSSNKIVTSFEQGVLLNDGVVVWY